jgi:sugar transferase (PEP-CTERM/EpsH1 system associated)
MTPVSAKPELILLCHRIPYPPNKGDKIRSFHWLKFLSTEYRVHLGAFVDDSDDWRHAHKIEEICESCCLLPLSRWAKTRRAAAGMLTGEPLSVSIYRDPRMRNWISQVCRTTNARVAFAYSSSVASYLVGDAMSKFSRIIDFVDVDSEKWGQYSASSRWPASSIYAREAIRLLEFEKFAAGQADVAMFVSAREVELFRSLAPTCETSLQSISNGVDTSYFDPASNFTNPFPELTAPLVFTGAMDYWANVDAVTWFAREVLPLVRCRYPRQEFWIVGARPASQVRRLASESVVVTGAVDDIRPYLQHCALAVAPMRIARGIQNKVLEAMAMGKTVVASPQGLDGLDVVTGKEVLEAHSAGDFAETIIGALSAGTNDISCAARNATVDRYSWQSSFRRLQLIMDGTLSPDATEEERTRVRETYL